LWRNTSLFDPLQIGASLLALPRQPPSLLLAAGGGFNPSLIPLPEEWRTLLHARHPNAYYLAGFRMALNQCDRLAEPHSHPPSDETRQLLKNCDKRHKKLCVSTSFVLLGKHFHTLANVVTGALRPRRPGTHHTPRAEMQNDTVLRGRTWETYGQDVRLDVVNDLSECMHPS